MNRLRAEVAAGKGGGLAVQTVPPMRSLGEPLERRTGYAETLPGEPRRSEEPIQ